MNRVLRMTIEGVVTVSLHEFLSCASVALKDVSLSSHPVRSVVSFIFFSASTNVCRNCSLRWVE